MQLAPRTARNGARRKAQDCTRNGPLQATAFSLRVGLPLIAALCFFGFDAGIARSVPNRTAPTNPRLDANQLVKEVIQHELQAQAEDQSLWKYRVVREKNSKRELLEVIETRRGTIERLLGVDGHALSPKERAIEDRRIERLLGDPEQFQKNQKIRNEDAEKGKNLLKMLPAAFLYQYDGTQGDLLKLKFSPNPGFHPTGRESEIFHHMEGTMLVDPYPKRLAGLDGRLTSEVKFMGGLLGHLDKGGTFSVRQKDVGSGHWEMTQLQVQMNGKVVLFKTITIRESEVYTNFQPVPKSTTPEKAAELLKKDTAS
jgi:hypothetical protein